MTPARWLLPLLLACLFMPTLALADARSGPYIVGGLMLDAGTANDISANAIDGELFESRVTLGQSRTGGTLAVGYLFAPGNGFMLMAEAGKDAGTDMHLSSIDHFTFQFVGTDEVSRRWQLTRDWYVALKPGWQVSPATTLYLSIAYHHGSARLDEEALTCVRGSCRSTGLGSFSSRMGGTGIGLGMQSELSEHLFLRAEVERIDFGTVKASVGEVGNISSFYSLEQLDASNTVGRVMIGWRF